MGETIDLDIDSYRFILYWIIITVKMKYATRLIMGDWSEDGHGKVQTISIKSNIDDDGIKLAYVAGKQKIGFDFIQDIAADYQDSYMDTDLLFKLQYFGFEQTEFDYTDDKSRICVSEEDYLNIYLFIVKLGNPDFEYEEVQASSINIGGYGLFM